MKINNAALVMYVKFLASLLLGAVAATGKSPFSLTSTDWTHIANVIWASAIPVLTAWLNPKHPLTLTVPKDTDQA